MNTATEKSVSSTQSMERSRPMDDVSGSIFQPDALLSDQYFETMRRKTVFEPEKRLMLAILEDAVSCLQHNFPVNARKNVRLFEDTKAWVVQKDGDWVFSFENVCEHLGLNPAYVRQGLMRWMRDRSSHEHARRVWERRKIAV